MKVPNTVREALALDEPNCDTLWREAIKRKMNALLELGSFEFREAGDIPSGEYIHKITYDI